MYVYVKRQIHMFSLKDSSDQVQWRVKCPTFLQIPTNMIS